MPTLEWANREVAVRAATHAPFRLLEHDTALSFGDPDNENMLIHRATRPRREDPNRRFRLTEIVQIVLIFSMAKRRHLYSTMNSAKVAMEAT
jgi:hypothetical protein